MIQSLISSVRRHPTLLLALLLVITFIPFLGETLFNTKGEPREAIVAVSMIQSGDWILPVSNGDIPYKPPMLAWCIAILSFLNGFEINEYISRLPSALSMIGMTMVVYHYTRRSTGSTSTAITTALILASMFEVNRAATNCRVDMLLTAFMVIAIYRLALNQRVSARFIDLPSILLLSGAVLTKGPVGMVIPCAIVWIYLILNGNKLWRTTLSLAVTGIASLILPLLWYIAAYNQGGSEFLDLVIEENFGRMTGSMSYESHVNPWWYNLVTLVAGMLPYTMLLLALPFTTGRSRLTTAVIRDKWTKTSGFDRLMIISALFIFIFYCIPASKRSVYLLPMYPMMAYAVARYIYTLYNKRPAILKTYSAIIASLPVIVVVAVIAIKITGPFGHKSTLIATRGLVEYNPGIVGWVVILISLGMSYLTWKAIIRVPSPSASIKRAIVTTLTLYWVFSSFLRPAVLNLKSDLTVARQLETMYQHSELPQSWLGNELNRFYTINFYLDNHLTRIDTLQRQSGQLLVARRHIDSLHNTFGHKYDFSITHQFDHRSCDLRDEICIVNYKLINDTK